jgi:hypothetical protein
LKTNTINIVAFDVPYPPDYGGAIDVFFKIKALKEIGVSVILHCFTYGRKEQKELEKLCEKVIYYSRKLSIRHFFSSIPFIVRSRTNIELEKNLNVNSFPILLEGIHCTSLVFSKKIDVSRLTLRLHNNEKTYYHSLSKAEANLWRKVFYSSEAIKLEKWQEKVFAAIPKIIGLNQQELDEIQNENKLLIPPFHGALYSSSSVNGNYLLIHGNFNVAENIQSLEFLLQVVEKLPELNFIVAGKSKNDKIENLFKGLKNITWKANPTDPEMWQLLNNCSAHLLYTEQATGVKLKLIRALHSGKTCIANSTMVKGSGAEDLVELAENKDQFIKLAALVSENKVQAKNTEASLAAFSDIKNAKRLLEFLQ